jgi:twitching motility protein PilT
LELVDLLKVAVAEHASDLHLMAGLPPVLRVNGEIVVTDLPPLAATETRRLLLADLPPLRLAEFERDMQLCHSLRIPDVGHFRIAIYKEMGEIGGAIRVGMRDIPRLEELGLPPVTAELTRITSGLVLITGPTGSGKTTTLNSMVDLINRERRCKIIMVEDPIEYVHDNKRSVIVQQEILTDAPSFPAALRHILRQDPNVIGVGEMRDYETISTALTAAETGHLVISTLHTPDAEQTVNRIIDVFPAHQQNQVRIQLAATLQAVIAQQLLPRVDQPGRVLATELLIATPAVRNMIREAKGQTLDNVIQTGQATGMHTMDGSLRNLYQKGIITYDTAASRMEHPEMLRGDTVRAAGNPPPGSAR